MKRIFLPVLLAIALLSGCQTAPPGFARIPQSKSYAHLSTGYVFPQEVAGFHLVDLLHYDAKGLDVSAGYNSLYPSRLIATVYLTPHYTRNLVLETKRWQSGVTLVHPAAHVVSEKNLLFKNRGIPGTETVYTYTELFDKSSQPLESRLLVFDDPQYILAFRFSYAASGKIEAAQRIKSFIDQLPEPHQR